MVPLATDASTDVPVGASWYVHGTPAWVIENAWPWMTIVPVRGVLDRFAATL
jgi:hypothetical protein